MKTDGRGRGGVGGRPYADFLEMPADERLLIDLRAAIARAIRDAMVEAGLSQAALARRIGTGQSRLAKAESAAGEVSLDLICRALFAAGGTLAVVASAASRASESDRAFETKKDAGTSEARLVRVPKEDGKAIDGVEKPARAKKPKGAPAKS